MYVPVLNPRNATANIMQFFDSINQFPGPSDIIWMIGGKANASAVEQNDPINEMKRLKFGTNSATATIFSKN